MNVRIRQEAGYDLALYGMSLSFKDRAIEPEDWWYFKKDNDYLGLDSTDESDWEPSYYPLIQRSVKMQKVATANANRGIGHNKFRRQIMLWVDIEAPRFWWSEFDTYKIGTTAQSESTMHTLMKRPMGLHDVEIVDSWDKQLVKIYNSYCESNPGSSIEQRKRKVPEGYLQRRIVTLNYEVLACIVNQRKNHRLPQWRTFIEAIYKQCEHKEILPEYPY